MDSITKYGKYDDDFTMTNRKKGGSGGGGKIPNKTKNVAKKPKPKSCYNTKYVRQMEAKLLNKP